MTDSNPTGLIARLVAIGIRHKFRRFLGWPVKPFSVSLEIAQYCVAHCMMRNIWNKSLDNYELSVADCWVSLKIINL